MGLINQSNTNASANSQLNVDMQGSWFEKTANNAFKQYKTSQKYTKKSD